MPLVCQDESADGWRRFGAQILGASEIASEMRSEFIMATDSDISNIQKRYLRSHRYLCLLSWSNGGDSEGIGVVEQGGMGENNVYVVGCWVRCEVEWDCITHPGAVLDEMVVFIGNEGGHIYDRQMISG